MRNDNQVGILGAELDDAALDVIVGGDQTNRINTVLSEPGGGFCGVADRIKGFLPECDFVPREIAEFLTAGNVVKRNMTADAGDEQTVGHAFVQELYGFGNAVAAAGERDDGAGAGGRVGSVGIDALRKPDKPGQPKDNADKRGSKKEFFYHSIFCNVRLTV